MAESRPDYNCDVRIVVDTEMPVRNAYQTRATDGTPIIAFTIPMLMDARNDDEIAFIFAHEYGHHIATHIEKAEQQAMTGAILMDTLMAASQAYASSYDPYADEAAVGIGRLNGSFCRIATQAQCTARGRPTLAANAGAICRNPGNGHPGGGHTGILLQPCGP